MKKILLVMDEIGWCFHSHCLEIKKRLSNEYYFEIVDHRQNIPKLAENFDLCYILDPMPLPYGYPPSKKTILGLRNEFLYREHPNGARGLYFDGFPGRAVSLNRCKVLHMVNKNQMNVFKDIVTCKLLLCQHGVDTDIFDVTKYTKNQNDILTVGVSGRDSANKGFSVVKSICDKLGIRFLSAQYGKNKITKEKMPEFYNRIDIYVCYSLTEGLHNGTLESGSMKVPVISAKCGAAEEIITDGVNGFLIDRNPDSLINALNKMKDKKLRDEMGENMYRKIMKNWTWKVRIDDFRKMFELYFGM